MTSVTYMNADLFHTTNFLTASNCMLIKNNREQQKVFDAIYEIFQLYMELRNTDYDIIYEQYRIE